MATAGDLRTVQTVDAARLGEASVDSELSLRLLGYRPGRRVAGPDGLGAPLARTATVAGT